MTLRRITVWQRAVNDMFHGDQTRKGGFNAFVAPMSISGQLISRRLYTHLYTAAIVTSGVALQACHGRREKTVKKKIDDMPTGPQRQVCGEQTRKGRVNVFVLPL